MNLHFSAKKNGKRLQFIIDGNPIPFFRSRHINRKSWDGIQQNIITYKNNLAHQFINEDALCGAIAIQADFYLPPELKRITSCYIDRPQFSMPQLSRLIQFIEESSRELRIYDDFGQICSLSAKKQYSDKPRSEFLFYEVAI